MVFPKGKELIKIFLEGIKNYPEFDIQKVSNPILLRFNGRSYMIFLKCISYAGNPYPKNTTRAQLPKREEFNSLQESDTFLFLGYDMENDLYVCWDPIKTRNRINQKSYVSFFCRQSIQDSVKEGEIKESTLTNGDKYVLFKRCDICSFFEMICLHFSLIDTSKKNDIDAKKTQEVSLNIEEGVLDSIESDEGVKLIVDQMLSNPTISKLEIIARCMNSYSSYYYRMRFTDWGRILEMYINNR